MINTVSFLMTLRHPACGTMPFLFTHLQSASVNLCEDMRLLPSGYQHIMPQHWILILLLGMVRFVFFLIDKSFQYLLSFVSCLPFKDLICDLSGVDSGFRG